MTRRGSKFDVQLRSQCGRMSNGLSKSIPGIHYVCSGTSDNQYIAFLCCAFIIKAVCGVNLSIQSAITNTPRKLIRRARAHGVAVIPLYNPFVLFLIFMIFVYMESIFHDPNVVCQAL